MSGFGGFGFGQNNQQQQQSTGFGGFGATPNTNTGFGSTGNTGFGSTNTTSTPLFGGGATTSGFGGSGGFGATTNNAFGAKPSGFGTAATTGGSIFGGGTATAGSGTGFGGGFGTNTASSSSPFGGSGTTGGGLFGQNKPAFGASTTTANPFGGAATSSPFGGGTTSAFGAPASTALGGATGECQGTGSVPFAPFVEKEPNNTTNQQNSFQSISFQPAYQKFSPEELRLADYAGGRKFGNASNQPGAFGASTGFGGSFGGGASTGGFGTTTNTNTGGGLFGGGATSSPFGANQPASTGFGATNTGGGLFGAAKPATTGLFGGTTSTAQPSTSLFGTSGTTGFGASNTSTGFGANTNTNTGGGLFGSNTPASKPPFSFGTSAPAAATPGFGGASTTTGFGGGGLFGGGATQAQQNSSTPFGQQQPAQTTGSAFGGGFGSTPQTGGGLFGGAKPATGGGLFGGASTGTTGGGLFGGSTPAANTNPFGTSTTTQTGGGLFGGAKPATTGGGLFGGASTTNTGGGLFGGFGGQNQNQNQQQQGSSLFGGANNNANQQKPSLFGGSQTQTGGGLFGGAQQNQGTSLFGGSLGSGTQQQTPQNNSMFGAGSMFNNSQQGQNAQGLTASITDMTPYGGGNFFADLNQNQNINPGPIATPLSSAAKQKKSTALPMYKLNSASTSRFTTPQKRGFGFSYSNYGTPGSASSTSSTPGAFGGSTFGSSFGRTLKTSVSTSSLRRTFGPEDSILAPGAFSASPSTRHFAAPSTPNQGGILKKRVSFDAHTINGSNGASSPLKTITNGSSPSAEELGYMRPPPSTNGNINGKKSTTQPPAPEMEQVQNNELAVVHEDEPAAPSQSKLKKPVSQEDQEPGAYWMSPSKDALENMNRNQRSKVTGLTVGRQGIGSVKFDVPVDLTNINIDEIMGDIVTFSIRSCTVYSNPAKKPPMGKGLNVPATIHLENSWPRKKDGKTPSGDMAGPRFKKHIERLKRVPDTTFLNYDKDNGVWSFSVQHFTTYGFPEDDETDGEGMSEFGQSTLSAPPDTPTPKSNHLDQSFASTSQMTYTESDPEDTFEFRRKKVPSGKVLPGAFDDQELYEDEDNEMEDSREMTEQESFLDNGSVGSQSENGVEEPMDEDITFQNDESVSIVDQDMAGSYPRVGNTAELDEDSQEEDEMDMEAETPGALVRARMRAVQKAETPVKRKFAVGNDWTATLKTTISPQKQDRAYLKSLIDIHGNDPQPDVQPSPSKRVVSDARGFATSIDLMNSLFGPTRSPVKAAPKIAKAPAKKQGFEWPYAKRPKTGDSDMSDLTEADRAFHDTMKPNWGADGTLVYAAPPETKPFGRSSRRTREKPGLLAIQKGCIVSEGRDIRFAKFSNEAAADLLAKQKAMTVVSDDQETVPFAKLAPGFSFLDFFDDHNKRDPAATHEKLVWQLASVLYDDLMIPEQDERFTERLRKDNLSTFWQSLVDSASAQQVALAKSHEERAIACLSGHRIADACGHLIKGKDFHLATLIALIGGRSSVRKDIREQLNEWQKSRILSEFSQPIRTLYELLAGNVCVCDGSKGAPIEDRIESFIMSKRFGLDWRQAFGLRLWYGILADDPMDDAIASFAQDLVQDKETTRPQAWYVEQHIPPLWEDKELGEREDLLWGLLKLYTFNDAPLEQVLCPENSQLSPLDFRLTWQLGQAMTVAQVATYGDEAEADKATLSFASQLTNEGSWLDTIFVLLHLSEPEMRAKMINDHLAQSAGLIGSEESQDFVTLTQTYKIPSSWIWEAKALYMRSVEKDSRGEVECLIKAGSFNEAHRTFAREVAPRNIVELDYDVLRALLHGFRGKENTIHEWHLGGQIYLDFIEVLDSQKRGRTIDHAVLERLLAGLPAVVEDSRHPSFMETVAVETISGAVAKVVIAMGKHGEKTDLPKILRLPLTEDNYLRHTVDLSLEYYRSAMAAK
ncbi:putative nucleoporin [Halenospora varia]|nr:putative nucleoporin [Halenospora varia]